MITVFYDGKCNLCSKEINYYKTIAPDNTFNWVDITVSSDAFKKKGYLISDGLRVLHAEDDDKHMHKGVDAFILMWKALPRWKYLGVFVSIPGIHFLSGVLYKTFASWRFKRLEHCQIAIQEENL